MKRFLAGFIVVLVLNACVTTSRENSTDSLDAALKGSVEGMVANLEQGSKIAILNFTSYSAQFSEYVLEELSVLLVNTKHFSIVDRNNLNLIRSEMNFQFSGEVDDDSATRIGKMLGAQYIISGSLSDIGNFYRLRLTTINVETAERNSASSYSVSKQDEVVTALLANTNLNRGETPFEGIWESIDPEEPVTMVFIGNKLAIKEAFSFDPAVPFTFTQDTITFDDAHNYTYHWGYSIQGDLMSLKLDDYQGIVLQRKRQ